MVVKIYGLRQSTCTQRVSTVLKELGIAYEMVPVDFAANEQKSEEYLQNKNPFGQIPVLVDEDGFKLFESRAISRYLTEKYGNGRLLPKDLKGRALCEQAMAIEQAQFDPSASGLAVEKFFKPIRGGQVNERHAEELQRTLEAKLQGYEIILSRQKYLAGNEITIADLFHLPPGWVITEKLGCRALKSDSLPNVKRWWADISSRDSWKAVQAELAQ